MDIQMPQLGETVTEGTITRWLKGVGDRVAFDDPLFEVATDKVDSEVPAPAAGTLTEIIVQEGETVEVGARLAVISDSEGAAAPAAAAASAAPAPEPEAPAPPQPAPPPPEPEPAPPREPERPAAAAPPPREPAPAPPREPEPSAPPAAAAGAAGGALMSPVVRRLLNEQGLDAGDVQGTGEGGRITRNDVLEAAARTERAPAAEARRAAPAPPAAPAPAAPTPAAAPPAPAPPSPPPEAERPAAAALSPAVGDETVPFDNMRRRTAEHMVRSKATSPHAYTSVEVDYERVDRVRRRAQEEWRAREGFPLTYLPFIVRAFCDTVEDYPHVNASVDGENLVVHHDIHVGIAVDLDFHGLIAPVIRSADGKRLRLISREIHDLASRARNKQLMPDEIMGGTFTITNPGPFGTYVTLPIINQPQVAILSTDGIRKRPWVVTGPEGEDSLAIRHVGVLALGWDHRAFDGAYAAAFLRAMKELVETHDWEAELA